MMWSAETGRSAMKITRTVQMMSQQPHPKYEDKSCNVHDFFYGFPDPRTTNKGDLTGMFKNNYPNTNPSIIVGVIYLGSLSKKLSKAWKGVGASLPPPATNSFFCLEKCKKRGLPLLYLEIGMGGGKYTTPNIYIKCLIFR